MIAWLTQHKIKANIIKNIKFCFELLLIMKTFEKKGFNMKKPSINSIIGTLENIKKEQNHLICHFYSTRINYEIIVTDPDQIETVKNIKPKSLACVQFEKKETVLKSQNYPHLEYKTDQYIAQNIDPIDQDLKKIMVELSNKNPTRAIENPYIIYRTATMVQKHQTYN